MKNMATRKKTYNLQIKNYFYQMVYCLIILGFFFLFLYKLGE